MGNLCGLIFVDLYWMGKFCLLMIGVLLYIFFREKEDFFFFLVMVRLWWRFWVGWNKFWRDLWDLCGVLVSFGFVFRDFMFLGWIVVYRDNFLIRKYLLILLWLLKIWLFLMIGILIYLLINK